MIRGWIGQAAVQRLARGIPVLELLMIAQVAVLAGRHVSKLDRIERRRLAALVREGRGRAAQLSRGDADELRALVAKLEPRLFAGSALDKLSPVPLPKRVLYGRRSNPARIAIRAPKKG
jgi:hypothetical protein